MVLEGTGGCGKSSLARVLAKEYGYYLLPEASSFAPAFPPPPTSVDEARRNERYAVEVEARRWAHAFESISLGQQVVADRGPVGTLSISFALSKMGMFNTYLDAVDGFVARLRTGELYPPTTTVLLTTAPQESCSRIHARYGGPSPVPWETMKALAYQADFYRAFYSRLEVAQLARTGIPRLHTIDTTGVPLQEIQAELLRILEGAPADLPSAGQEYAHTIEQILCEMW